MGLTLLNLRQSGSHGTVSSAVGSADEPRISNRVARGREAASPALLFGQDPQGFRPIGTWNGFGRTLSPRDLNPTRTGRHRGRSADGI